MDVIAKYLFLIFRWVLILIFFISWRLAVNYIADHYHWTVEKTQFWLSQRLKLFVWLVLFELVICEHIVLVAFKAIEESYL